MAPLSSPQAFLRTAPVSNTTGATVVLVAGPSGSGKSTLAAGWDVPVLRLDDFYRDGDDPDLPRDRRGRVDWDSPLTWLRDDALAAVLELATTGKATVPRYEIGASSRVGSHSLELGGATTFVAEGLFADQLVEGCRAAGVLGDALVLAPSASRTALRRFVRDVSESRKSLPVLVRRGVRLWREHPVVVQRCVDAGMRRG